MSLLKLPLLLCAAIARHISATPPYPGPSSASPELVGRGAITEVFLSQKSIPKFFTLLYWASTIAEATVVIARHAPFTIAKPVLSFLTVDGCPARIGVTPLFLIGTLITFAGGLIRFQCYRALGRLFTFELTIRKDHRLVTNGPYAIVRHPSYTGYILASVGTLCCNIARGSWMRECGVLNSWMGGGMAGLWTVMMFAVICALIWRINKEEKALKKRFGKEWEVWAQRVQYKLAPGIY